jgi:MoaA/NifB/PqqE/SkfB family radical SAM enzyme
MLTLDQVRRIHVELTTRCNARCPMCMRNYRGFEYNSGYPDCELSLEQFKHILTPDVLAVVMQPDPPINGRVPINYGFQGVSFNGNLGDFASASDAAEIVEYLVAQNVNVYINTNGSLRNTTWWSRLAHPRVTVGFALDGLADTHILYRQDTDWNKIINNARSYISAGGRAIWRFVPFEHNQHQESECQSLAKEIGFEYFENIYDGRDSTPVFTRTGEYSHQIGPDSRPPNAIPKIKDLLHSHVTWFDAGTVRSAKDKPELNLRCIHKLNREIYIAADGSVYPCCYLGFYPNSMKHPGNDQIRPLIYQNNALEHDLVYCLNWFDQVEQSWVKESIAAGRLYTCVNSCGQS